ncbi:MAG: hypothetical protein JWL77_3261 [Chthonomonadaceae bacterium]|nr:hypothetical protein [Chthonomonadaceae bacterium]
MKQTATITVKICGMVCFTFLSAVHSSGGQQHGPAAIYAPDPNIAYVAVQKNNDGKSLLRYYDRGRYSSFGPTSFDVYDGTDTYLRWAGDTKKNIAQLDTPLPDKRLLELIQHDGADLAAKKSGIDRSLLDRFAHLYKVSPPRVLSHPLPVILPQSPEFQRLYQKLPDEKVAGQLCNVFLARDSSGDKIWVEPSVHIVLRQHKTYASDNPRIPPSVWDWEVSQFTQVPSVDPKHFQLPSGVTVILPRILSDLPLPPGVHRKLLEGKNSYTGHDIGMVVTFLERRLREQNSLR